MCEACDNFEAMGYGACQICGTVFCQSTEKSSEICDCGTKKVRKVIGKAGFPPYQVEIGKMVCPKCQQGK